MNTAPDAAQPKLADVLARIISDMKAEDERRQARIQATLGRINKLISDYEEMERLCSD